MNTEHDRALDALVAEHVLGYSWIHNVNPQNPGSNRCTWLVPPHALDGYLSNHYDGGFARGQGEGAIVLWPVAWFSSDLSDAFKVVDAMREKGWSFTAEQSYEWGEQWTATFTQRALDIETMETVIEKREFSVDVSLPEAICRAALYALDVTVSLTV